MRIISLIMLITASILANANDGVYFTSGNFLIPTQETTISVKKEILTITIGKDSMATVDVYYEFYNPGKAKVLNMAFEASPSEFGKLNRNGTHPDIVDFTVEMNGYRLQSENHLIAQFWKNGKPDYDFKPIDMSQWKTGDELPDTMYIGGGTLYSERLDSCINFCYAYNFKAAFRKGINHVHHTYKYRMSYNVASSFEIPYWLTPATRWANRQVDDFTLRIRCDRYDPFYLYAGTFRGADFQLTGNKFGRVWHVLTPDSADIIFADLHSEEAVLEWHKRDFRPEQDMCISSADMYMYPWQLQKQAGYVVVSGGETIGRYIGECGDSLLINAQDIGLVAKKDAKVVLVKAEDGKGHLFLRDNRTGSDGTVQVYEKPSKSSRKICTLANVEEDIPDDYPCLGHIMVEPSDSDDAYTYWYKIEVDGKEGYVEDDTMYWDPL